MKALYKQILKEINEGTASLHNRSINDRILLVDGLNTFIRSWTTTPNMNDNGEHVGGITGFLKSIGYAIRQTNPTKVVLVFDGKDGSGKRKKIYEGYKSERGKNRFRVNRTYPEMMSEEEEDVSMKRQFVWLAEYLDVLPLSMMIYDGIEADDVIAFINNQFPESEKVIMSTDKDFLQLIDDKTIVYSPTKKILYNIDVLQTEYGLHYNNYLLYRVLDGDASDNIPGIKGCGLKTLLKRFPEISHTEVTIDDLIGLCEERRGKIKLYDDILEAKDQLALNQNLMNLKEPKIGTDQKLKILDKFIEPIKKYSKPDFIRMAMRYRMESNWGTDVHTWLRETFDGLVYGK